MRRHGIWLATLAVALAPLPAFAHTGDHGMAFGLMAGLTHPLGGLDHVTAMLAIGVLAGISGQGRAAIALPVAFLAATVLGGVLGMAGIALPAVEAGVLAMAVVLGFLVAVAARLPAGVALALAGIAGLLHGHAHGLELAEGAGAISYALGFLATTALLHGAGMALARTGGHTLLPALRLAGGGLAAAVLLVGILG
jgi:urease accessory protein